MKRQNAVIDLPTLMQSLNHSDPMTRATAADRLGALRAVEAIPDLIPLLDDDSYYTPEDKVANRAFYALKQMGPPLVAPLLSVFDHLQNRVAAVALLGFSGDTRVTTVLTRLLDDANPDIRREAAEAIGRLRDPRPLQTLVELAFEDRAAKVQHAAIMALGEIGDPRALDALCELLLDDDNPKRQMRAATALGVLGDERAIPDLLALLERNADDFAQREAEKALLRLGYSG